MAIVQAMMVILLVWAGLALLLSGLGRLLLQLGFHDRRASFLWSIWLGYAVLVIALSLWHFVGPIDEVALALAAALSVVGWMRMPLHRMPRTSRGALVGSALLALWAANLAAGPCTSYDSANYQIPIVIWSHYERIVPGVANLSPLYALNTAAALPAAMLESGWGEGRSVHLHNGFLWVLLACTLLHLALGIRSQSSRRTVAAVTLLFPTSFMAVQGKGAWLASHSTDLPLWAVLFAAFCALLPSLRSSTEEPKEPLEAEEDRGRQFAGLMLLAIAPMLKATAALFSVAVFVPLVLPAVLRPARVERAARVAAILAVLCGSIWVLRNVISTGYPLYPLPFGALAVDWALPREHVESLAWWPKAYARAAGDWSAVSEGRPWLRVWLKDELRPQIEMGLIPLVAIAALFPGAIANWLRRRVDITPFHAALPLAIAFWFVTAPLIRYGSPLLWMLAALVAADGLASTPAVTTRLGLGTIAAAICPLLLRLVYAPASAWESPRAAVGLFLVSAGPAHGLHPLPRPEMRRVITCRGQLEVLVPALPERHRTIARWTESLPWASPQPATAFAPTDLCPREPGNHAAGYRIQPEDRRSWAYRYAVPVAQLARETGWNRPLLAVYFFVRPALIDEALAIAGDREEGVAGTANDSASTP